MAIFNKRLLVSIILDTKKLEKEIEGSCVIECIPTTKTLSKEEKEDLIKYLNFPLCLPNRSRSGEIGRRAGLKIQW